MKVRIATTFLSLLAAAMIVVAGCNQATDNTASQTQTSGPNTDGEKFLLADEPEDAQDVIAARKEANNDDEVAVVGRIGGSVNPWVEGMAVFSIVDPSLKACSDIEGDQCPTPWDYCCETELKTGTALVKLVDQEGNVINTDARELLALKELQTVVARGKAQRDDAGNLTVLATGIHVRE